MAGDGGQEALDAVRIHHREGEGDLAAYCRRCGLVWPCEIQQAAGWPLPKFLDAWWAEQRRVVSSRREYRLRAEAECGNASEVVDEAVEVVPSMAVALLRALAEAVPDAGSPGEVGAGPLEHLPSTHAGTLRSEAGRPIVDAVDEGARQSPRFREALRSVVLGDEIPTEVVERLRRFLS